MPILNKSGLTTFNNSRINDNTSEDITPADVRFMLQDIIDSSYNRLDDPFATVTGKADLTGATFTGGIYAPSLTATTIFSGATKLDSLFARTVHTHAISDITGLQTQLDNISATTSTSAFSASSVNYSINPINGNNISIGDYAFVAGGQFNKSSGVASFAGGYSSSGTNANAFAYGNQTVASAYASIALGNASKATDTAAFASGNQTLANGYASFAANISTESSGYAAFAANYYNKATGSNAAAFGSFTLADGYTAFATGANTVARGSNAFTQGYATSGLGYSSAAFGNSTLAAEANCFAVGERTKAIYSSDFAQGYYTVASGSNSHSEGQYTTSAGYCSHAEGNYTKSIGYCSHSEGSYTIASGNTSKSSGYYSEANGDYSFIHSNTSTVNANDATILGGFLNRLTATATGSTILGGSNITGSTRDTVYAPNIKSIGGITATTYYSGATLLETVVRSLVTGATLQGNYLSLSGGTVSGNTGFAAISATTIYSGATLLDSLFAITNHTHVIADVTGLQTQLDGKANLTGATFTGTINVRSVGATTNNTYDLGSSSVLFANIFSTAVNGTTIKARDGGSYKTALDVSTTNILRVGYGFNEISFNKPITNFKSVSGGSKILEADISGNAQAVEEIVSYWIFNATVQGLLSDTNNWGSKVYTGSTLSGYSLQMGQVYVDSDYRFEMISTTTVIRTARV